MLRQSSYRGFTLVELMTCMGVVVVLLSLCMPLVQAARQASHVATCKQNLKQIAFALGTYHDIFWTLPPGWVSRHVKGQQTQGFGWPSLLLPFMEEADVYVKLEPTGGGFDNLGRTREVAAKTHIPGFRCPVDTTPERNPFRGDWPTSNYSGNYGHIPFPRWMPAQTSDYWPGQTAPFFPKTREFPNELSKRLMWPSGLFWQNSKLSTDNIIDGTSNTIMVGERSVTSGAGIWLGVTAGTHENDVLTDGSHASRPNHGLRSLSSLHGVINVAMADGSVRALNPEIDSAPNADRTHPMGVYQKLSARDDGQIIEF